MATKRGEVILVDFESVKGSEQGKTRPCLVIQNDVGNAFSSTTIIAAITSQTDREYPFTVRVNAGEGGLPKDSLILLNQLRTISVVHRASRVLGYLKPETMKKVDEALKYSLGLERV